MTASHTERIRNTITYLQRCRTYRAAGGQVAFTTDPTWLVNMAINRRAGWPDDPSTLRGSAIPVGGKYPRNASGDDWAWLCRFARDVNTPRLMVRDRDCPPRYRRRYLDRLLHRLSCQ